MVAIVVLINLEAWLLRALTCTSTYASMHQKLHDWPVGKPSEVQAHSPSCWV